MLTYLVQHAFAGLWSLVWHFGIAIGVTILCGVGVYFAPTLKLKVCFGVVGAICLALFVGEIIGVKISAARCTAQERAVTTFVKKVVTGTQSKKSRAARDPWNSPNN